MKIVLVIDQFDDANNGTTISARRFAMALKEHGNEVRVIAIGKPADYKYAVRQMRFFPIVEHLITSQGMRLAIPNKHVFEKAAAWADVVHFMMPSPMAIMGLKHVERLGIPHTAAFHCQPENITFTLHLGNSTRVNDFVYNRFRDTFFNRFTHIHCPSNMIAEQLRRHGYTAQLHVISNGISPQYVYGKRPKEEWMQGYFNVLSVGRYAGEKRQDVLIEAAAKCRHAQEIQVILAGKGPLEKKYRKLAEKLPNPAVMGFYEPERLLDILHMADLYVHTSDAEIEGMSCTEDMSQATAGGGSYADSTITASDYATYSDWYEADGEAADGMTDGVTADGTGEGVTADGTGEGITADGTGGDAVIGGAEGNTAAFGVSGFFLGREAAGS